MIFCFLNAASTAIAKKLKVQVSFLIACCRLFVHLSLLRLAATVAQWVRAFAPQAEGWEFESQPQQTQVIKQVVTAPLRNARH